MNNACISLQVLTSDDEVLPSWELEGIKISFGDGFEVNDISLPYEQHEFTVKRLPLSENFEASLCFRTNLNADAFSSEILEVVSKIGQSAEQFIINASSTLSDEGGDGRKRVRFSGSKDKVITCKNTLLRHFEDCEKRQDGHQMVLDKAEITKLHKSNLLQFTNGAPTYEFVDRLEIFQKVLLKCPGSAAFFEQIKDASRVLSSRCMRCQQRPGAMIVPGVCEHAYCTDCFTQAVKESKATLFCCPACEQDTDASPIPVPMNILRLMLTEEEFVTKARDSAEKWFQKQGDRFGRCPYEGCGLQFRASEEKTLCPGCLERIA